MSYPPQWETSFLNSGSTLGASSHPHSVSHPQAGQLGYPGSTGRGSRVGAEWAGLPSARRSSPIHIKEQSLLIWEGWGHASCQWCYPLMWTLSPLSPQLPRA